MRDAGGSFVLQMDNELILNCTAYQTSEMKDIQEVYGDFVIHDETHNTNVLGLACIPTVVVDCLGKSAISSIALAKTENHDDLISLLEELRTARI